MLRSESDFEFSSDCLPIDTSSSSQLFDPTVATKEELDLSKNVIGNRVQLHQVGGVEKDSAPLSPLTDNIPPTPTLTANQGQSESETEAHEKISSTSPRAIPREASNAKKKNEASKGYKPARQSDTDPVSRSGGVRWWLI